MTARRRVAVAALLATTAAALLAGAWWVFARPLSATERELVGAWEFRPDAAGPGTPRHMIEFRPGRTCVWRHFDRATGLPQRARYEPVPWRVRGSRLRIDHTDTPVIRRRDFFIVKYPFDVIDLTPDGSGGYRCAGEAVDFGSVPTAYTGTLTRISPAPPE